MELLIHRSRRAALTLNRTNLNIPVAYYRTKKNQAKRAAAAGQTLVDSTARQEKKKPLQHTGKQQHFQQRKHADNKRNATVSRHKIEDEEVEEPVDVEAEWKRMRTGTMQHLLPVVTVPRRERQELENKLRMRRLGLLREEEEDDLERELRDYAERKQHHQQQHQQQKPLHFHDAHDDFSVRSPKKPMRRPVAQKQKQFTNMQSAPEEVMEREFLVPDEPDHPKALDVAVIGRPNAGKSSIMNSLLNVTISAVSAKYNTTRDRMLGILTETDSQITFYDTPGLIKPKESHDYVRSLVTTAAETVESVDMSMLVVDAVKRLDEAAIDALAKVITTSAQVSSPIMLVMNKYDLVGEREDHNLTMKIKDLSQMIEEIYETHYDADSASLDLDPLAYIGKNSIKVSALKGYGMKGLKRTLLSLAVDRPWSYHSSMKSDQSDLSLVTEIIREKLFRRFNKELPYMFEQENVGWTKFKDKSIRIDQDIFVPAPRVRKMVIGHNGDTIRSVGIAAREEIEALLKRPVHLYLNVRVR